MHKTRLEAFTDGVLAIFITIMVLELKVPAAEHLADLQALVPKFISYVLSFIYVGIYWNNHHHTLQAARSVDGGILWANLHLLFWLSLLPFTSGWLGENHFAQEPMLLYGINLLLCGLAYTILSRALIAHHGKDSPLAHAFGKDLKGNSSLALYIAGIALTLINPWLGFAAYSVVALMWLVPDPRMNAALQELSQQEPAAHS
ncbi:MAG: TMEM175 family protein [Gammaproteobacteria bacterium]